MLKDFIHILTLKQVYKTIIVIFLTVFIYYVLISFLNHLVIKGRNDLEIKRRKTIINLFENIIKYVFVIILLIIFLSIFGIDTKSFLAGLGIAGVVVGLALQDALKDIISGVSIIMDDYFDVGDVVEIKGFKGTVISLGLKATKIKSDNGSVNILSNRNIDNVINYSKNSPHVNLYIVLDSSNKQQDVEKILTSVLEDLKQDEKIKKDSAYIGIEEILDNKIKYVVRINCDRNSELAVKRLFNKKVKELIDANKLKK